jgi:hypothetical protein
MHDCDAGRKQHYTRCKATGRLVSWNHPLQVLVVFENGRIEEFLTAATLLPEDVASPVYLPRIARKLRYIMQQPSIEVNTMQHASWW